MEAGQTTDFSPILPSIVSFLFIFNFLSSFFAQFRASFQHCSVCSVCRPLASRGSNFYAVALVKVVGIAFRGDSPKTDRQKVGGSGDVQEIVEEQSKMHFKEQRFNYLNVIAVTPCFQLRFKFLILIPRTGCRWRHFVAASSRFLGGNPNQIPLGLFDQYQRMFAMGHVVLNTIKCKLMNLFPQA